MVSPPQEIKVGAAYQAEIPACVLPSGEDEASLPIEERGAGGDTLLWSLRGTNEEQGECVCVSVCVCVCV